MPKKILLLFGSSTGLFHDSHPIFHAIPSHPQTREVQFLETITCDSVISLCYFVVLSVINLVFSTDLTSLRFSFFSGRRV